jgi:tetrahydromethanopterin S-methyltransferase subunit B
MQSDESKDTSNRLLRSLADNKIKWEGVQMTAYILATFTFGLFVGAFLGLALMACLAVAKKYDEADGEEGEDR